MQVLLNVETNQSIQLNYAEAKQDWEYGVLSPNALFHEISDHS